MNNMASCTRGKLKVSAALPMAFGTIVNFRHSKYSVARTSIGQ